MNGDNYIVETPSLSRLYCPGCEPEVDVMREIVEVRHCHLHEIPRDGIDDAGLDGTFSGTNLEAGGEANKAVCDFLHRPEQRAR